MLQSIYAVRLLFLENLKGNHSTEDLGNTICEVFDCSLLSCRRKIDQDGNSYIHVCLETTKYEGYMANLYNAIIQNKYYNLVAYYVVNSDENIFLNVGDISKQFSYKELCRYNDGDCVYYSEWSCMSELRKHIKDFNILESIQFAERSEVSGAYTFSTSPAGKMVVTNNSIHMSLNIEDAFFIDIRTEDYNDEEYIHTLSWFDNNLYAVIGDAQDALYRMAQKVMMEDNVVFMKKGRELKVVCEYKDRKVSFICRVANRGIGSEFKTKLF